MTLTPGSRLSSDEILSALGAGGMGEVYKARDLNLKRDVAIKVLPATLTLDAERLARFDREAHVLASLNHPHIAAIYGFEASEGVRALAFGCVLYETLAGRRAFHGQTTSDTISAILTADPEWSALPARTPASIRGLLRRCLQKETGRRARDIGDLRLEIDEALAGSDAPPPAGPAPATAAKRRRVLIAAATCALFGAAGVAVGWRVRPQVDSPAAAHVRRFTFRTTGSASWTGNDGGPLFGTSGGTVAVSPDGTRVVYSLTPTQ